MKDEPHGGWKLERPQPVLARLRRLDSASAGRSRFAAVPIIAVVTMLVFFGLSFTHAARADSGLTLTLQAPASPNPLGSDVVVTAIARDGAGSPVAGLQIVWFGPQGYKFCTTDATGDCSITVTPPWTHGGFVNVSAWADLNGNFNGDFGEPFDQVQVVWEPQVASVSLTASATVSPVRISDADPGAPVVFTVKAVDASGVPVVGASISVGVSGPVDGFGGPCGWTDEVGECATDVTRDVFPGTQTFARACFDANGNGAIDSNELLCGTASVTWTAPTSTRGRVVGKGTFGWSPKGGVTRNATFAVGFASDGTTIAGSCLIIDAALGHTLQCVNSSTLVITGTHALALGDATLDGVPTAYRIDIDSDASRQTFHIRTLAGFGESGRVISGKLLIQQ